MTGHEWLLELLQDEQNHTGPDIEQRFFAETGEKITVHSRIAQLRADGWVIIGTRTKGKKGEYAYRLHGRIGGHARVRPEKEPVVQAYIYMTHVEDRSNGRLCHIISRSEPNREWMLPCFLIEFTNGDRLEVDGDELSPWYPVR